MLASRSITSWVDEGTIEPGDSIIDAITMGSAWRDLFLVLVTSEPLSRNARLATRHLGRSIRGRHVLPHIPGLLPANRYLECEGVELLPDSGA